MSDEQLSTISAAFHQTCQKHFSRQAQLFNPELYHNDNNGSFTYGEMRARVEKIACGLLALGLEKKEMAAIMAGNSPYWTQADLAIINCGCVTVTIYPTLSLNEASYIINDSNSSYLFVGNKDILDRMLPGLDKMPTLKKIIVMDMEYEGDNDGVINLKELINLGQEHEKKHAPVYKDRWQSISLDDWASIIYTSGTTGQGKGAILTHRSFASRIYYSLESFSKTGVFITEEDVCLSFLPLSHIFDRGCAQMLAVYTGACIAYADKPATILQDMQKYNPTWFCCVPRLYERIYITIRQQMSASPVKRFIFSKGMNVGKEVLKYRTDDRGCVNMSSEYDVKSKLPFGLRLKYTLLDYKIFSRIRALFGNRFKLAFSAGAGISAELATVFYTMGVRVVEGYGLTETCTACNVNPITGIKPGKIGPATNGSLGRLAEDGEYETTGAGMFVGYLNKPKETAAAFTPDGWFKTGDIGEIDADGYVKILDRKKAIIVMNTGKNVAPAKIENLFATSSAVEQIFVAGDDREYIATLVVPNFDYFIKLFDRDNITYDKSRLVYSNASGIAICVGVGDDFVEQQVLKEKVAEEVKRVNKKLEGFEAIKKHAILNKRFTEEAGEITPTLKPKKQVILQKYRDIVEKKLYG